MNYGKFFRLNKHLSRIEDGFAIYDYIDLPAYFTPSKDNLMSPKYPISVMVLGDSVVFKLHYSAYKIEKVSKQDAQDESIKGYSNYPQYIYNIEAPSLISENKVKGGDTTKIVHMEEIILELPFTDTVGRSLSDTIRDIYDTQFPLIQRDNGKDSDLSSKEKSSGGRYLEKLIRTRYLEEKVDEVKDVNSHFYESLRKISDGTASYSTLWLMGLVKGDKNDVRYRRTDKKGNVIGFLRKLLLDFMFDLKHSDVFQNSANYQKMYSGLMSDFYFSALMHKCEYYYYRKLTREAIDEIEDGGIDKKTRKQRKESIKVLYANELVKAEDLWVQDIMNPQAEKDFEHRYPGKSKIRREIFGGYSFQQWPSWFAEPEEEMRRVCFTMKEESGIKHICNADTLVEYLKVNEDGDQISISMLATRNSNRELISRWFLKRYDFNDVIHLHLFKHLNVSLLLIIVFFLTWLFGIEIIGSDFSYEKTNMRIIVTGIGVILCPFIGNLLLNYASGEWAVKTRQELILKRTTAVIILVIISISLYYIFDKYIDSLWGQIVYILFSIVAYCLFFKITPYIHPISSLHLLFPRLVAAITAAWLTMSMGFDIYVSFFDAKPSLPTAISIAGIVFGFIMYEINRIMPSSSVWRKLFRSLEFLVISYCASLIVGLAVINFVGEKYLERGGYMEDYYKEYVNGNKESVWNRKFDYNKLEGKTIDTVSIHGKVDALSQISHKDNNKPFITKHQNIFNTGHNLYVMRDFLIMFSFIAMFWGIFIQMIFTGEKQMTEL